MVAVIKRFRVYASPGKNYRFAWKYFYDVEGLGKALAGFDRLGTAVRVAKSNGAKVIVKAWEAA